MEPKFLNCIDQKAQNDYNGARTILKTLIAPRVIFKVNTILKGTVLGVCSFFFFEISSQIRIPKLKL